MSRKKVLFIVAGVIVALLVIAGITANAALADDGQSNGPGGKLLDRVAQILNIDRQKLADAFKQAGTELRQDKANSMFEKWVADGKLTQDQADQYKAWLTAKPTGPFGPFTGQNMMDKLLENGKVTQAQYDAWKAWRLQKPTFDLPRPDRPSGVGLRRGHAGAN